MSQIIEVKVPDIGDFESVPVIELYVKVGDSIKLDDAICTLESDKATMDVPSTAAGVVTEVLVSLGSKVGEGALLIKVEAGGAAAAPAPAAQAAAPAAAPTPVAAAPAAGGGVVEVKVPDIGDFAEVPVIELYVKVGDSIKVDDAIATLESDKATMDVPSTVSGVIKEVLVQLGSKVGEGTVLIKVETGASASVAAPVAQAPAPAAAPAAISAPVSASTATNAPVAVAPGLPAGSKVHASPSVRAYARELGVDLSKVAATGPKNRIVKEDLTKYVKGVMSGAISGPVASATGGVVGGGVLDLLPWPKVNFEKFGEIEVKPLSRIKKISGQNLSRNWVMIPAVTYHEDADITDLEAFRVQLNKENEKSGNKLTMLAFLIKACVKAMQRYPEFNSSLDGDNLVMKKYFNIGFAADTPNGLVVPVIKNAEKKGVFEIAKESGELAKQARDGKLKPADMSGACFTISSLGGIGGTYFAPIVNAPEVAILGVNKSALKPVWDGKQFVPRLTLPLSLTADHRVIDGALATRFNVYVAELLADMRRMIV
ncbi:MAG: dihydrolipoyllysine-residue acetyltransferase [Dechloromonas sp.]|uniref:Acetyltransferase component of pyruvate dehydrogenase complex n=1 Tax=Candidatus Dechloromonas phosphorivorans TaxID=2899244 RepID=A0A935N2A7_9RHOO|nr:dihydrolipoyllysine-residue acetyltransferase [Candidatus Dechloromonas phosphorivorans]